jgi:hypothetical protein
MKQMKYIGAMLTVLGVATAGCSTAPHKPHAGPTSSPIPWPTSTPTPPPHWVAKRSPSADSCGLKPAPGTWHERIVRTPEVITIGSAYVRDGQVAFLAQGTCRIYPGDPDQGSYYSIGRTETYRLLPAAKITLVEQTDSGPRPRSHPVTDLIKIITSSDHPRLTWYGRGEMALIRAGRDRTITAFEQMWHP